MATTTRTDVVVYEEQFRGAFVETLQQNVAAFNAQSRGALTVNTSSLLGHYQQESFWDEVSVIARRDSSVDSATTVASTALTQDEFISVKLDRRNGPFESNYDAFRKIGADTLAEMGRVIGAQTAAAVPQEMLTRALAAIEGKLDSVTALEHDATDGTLAITDLNTGLSKFGDASGRILIWVMHSKPWFDLVGNALTATATAYGSNAFGASLFQGTPITLGRPVLVTDSASLVEADGVSTGVDHYITLGLTANAAQITMSESPLSVFEGPRTGSANLYVTWQSEYSYNLAIKGCKWDTANGGINPTDANVATATNWDTVVADNKLLPGVHIRSQ